MVLKFYEKLELFGISLFLTLKKQFLP